LETFLKSDLAKQWFLAGVRHFITVGTPALIAAGVIAPSQANDLLGCGFFIAGLAWSLWQKHGQAKAIVAAAQ
jgi:hypothetical protein